MLPLLAFHQSIAGQEKENAYGKISSLGTEQFVDDTFRKIIRTYILRIMVQSDGQSRSKFDQGR